MVGFGVRIPVAPFDSLSALNSPKGARSWRASDGAECELVFKGALQAINQRVERREYAKRIERRNRYEPRGEAASRADCVADPPSRSSEKPIGKAWRSQMLELREVPFCGWHPFLSGTLSYLRIMCAGKAAI